jgi:hypothetical protein
MFSPEVRKPVFKYAAERCALLQAVGKDILTQYLLELETPVFSLLRVGLNSCVLNLK